MKVCRFFSRTLITDGRQHAGLAARTAIWWAVPSASAQLSLAFCSSQIWLLRDLFSRCSARARDSSPARTSRLAKRLAKSLSAASANQTADCKRQGSDLPFNQYLSRHESFLSWQS